MTLDNHTEPPADGAPEASNAEPSRDHGEFGLFLRRWLANPLRVGAIVPSAPALARRMARETWIDDAGVVVELGPGTGAVTRALLAAGVPEERLILVERDRHMHAFLTRRFPAARVILGDAAKLDALLPKALHGRVTSVVSSLPLMNLPNSLRDDIVRASFRVLAPQGRFVQYTYGLFSPLPRKALGLEGEKVAFAGINLPPATVWCYRRAD